MICFLCFFFFKQKTAYEMRISDWSSDVCSSDLDPYHGPGQAHGLCFSVQPGVRTPPSLVNIYKEMQSDLGIPRASHGYLKHWASQGVLLLNNFLTVESGMAASHQGKGWEKFNDAAVAAATGRGSLRERVCPYV